MWRSIRIRRGPRSRRFAAQNPSDAELKQRLDRWLYFARAVKSRTLAQKLIEAGGVRVNSVRTTGTDHPVGEGDVLTIAVHSRLLVWRVRDAGARRGPPEEARGLYEDLSPNLKAGE
jgi:ribosome-associated heat shock protein Hsp15